MNRVPQKKKQEPRSPDRYKYQARIATSDFFPPHASWFDKICIAQVKMKFSTVLLFAPLVAALPVDNFDPDPELTAARANITERELSLHERQHAVSLHDLWKSRGNVYFGVATDQNLLTTGKNAAIIQRNFGQVTPENSMKWDALQPSQGQFNWARADYLVNWARTNNKMVRGHTLIWHSQLPSWVANINNANTLRSVIQTHVTTVVNRYKGRIQHWVCSFKWPFLSRPWQTTSGT
jgi:endo-1,4-beta-xylanase